VLLVRFRDARDDGGPRRGQVRRGRRQGDDPVCGAVLPRGERLQGDGRERRRDCGGLRRVAYRPGRDEQGVLRGIRTLAVRDGDPRILPVAMGPGGRALPDFLRLDDVRKRFGGIRAVDGVTTSVREGELVGLIGPNGSGKSTLFNVITGVYAPDAGSITFRGDRVDTLDPWEIFAKGVVRSFQNPRLFRGITVIESALVPPRGGTRPHVRRHRASARGPLRLRGASAGHARGENPLRREAGSRRRGRGRGRRLPGGVIWSPPCGP